MFVRVESPHLGEGYLKVVDHKLLFEEDLTDRTFEVADLARGGRLLRRRPPASFLMDTYDRLLDDEDAPSSPDHVLVVTGACEVLRFRLLGDPDEQWRALERGVQEAHMTIRQAEASPQRDSS